MKKLFLVLFSLFALSMSVSAINYEVEETQIVVGLEDAENVVTQLFKISLETLEVVDVGKLSGTDCVVVELADNLFAIKTTISDEQYLYTFETDYFIKRKEIYFKTKPEFLDKRLIFEDFDIGKRSCFFI